MGGWLTFSQHNPYYSKWLGIYVPCLIILTLYALYLRAVGGRKAQPMPTDTSLQSSTAAAL